MSSCVYVHACLCQRVYCISVYALDLRLDQHVCVCVCACVCVRAHVCLHPCPSLCASVHVRLHMCTCIFWWRDNYICRHWYVVISNTGWVLFLTYFGHDVCIVILHAHVYAHIDTPTHPHTHTHKHLTCMELNMPRRNAVLLWSWLFSLPHTACPSLCHHVSLFISLSPSLRVSHSVSLSRACACTFSSHSVTLSHFLCVSLSAPVSLYPVCSLSVSTFFYLSVSVCLSLSFSCYFSLLLLLFSYCSLSFPFSLSLGLISLWLYRSVCLSLSFSLSLSTW